MRGDIYRALFAIALILPIIASLPSAHAATPIQITASDPVFAGIARQIGGSQVNVTLAKTLSSPPFSGPAQLLIGKAGRKPLLRFSLTSNASKEAAEKAPAVWFDVRTVRSMAQKLAAQLRQMRPEYAAIFTQNALQFDTQLEPVESKIQFLSKTYRGTKVFATDFLYKKMLDELGFKIRESEAVSQIAKTGAAHVAAIKKLKSLINESSVGVLIYDVQSKNVSLKQLEQQAMEAGVPTIGIRETIPASLSYPAWMLRTLNTLQGGLNEAAQ